MKKRMVVSALIMVMSLWSVAYAYNGTGPLGCGKRPLQQELLGKLPAEKEMLFHQTMREARGKASGIREQMKTTRQEIEEIITADRFEEDLFRKKMRDMQALQKKMHATMEDAVVMLATQFTADERKVLIKLLPGKMGHHGPHATKWRHK